MNPIIEEAESFVSHPSMTLRMLSIALEALSSRALVWITTLGAGTLWGFVMLEPTVLKIVTAIGFCGTVLFPVLYRDSRGG